MNRKLEECRKAAYYHVSFATEEWEDLPHLSRQFLTAHEMMEQVEHWNLSQQKPYRDHATRFGPMALAQFMTIEVHHG